ncbi:Rne/Rng family ribonuclease, partial [Streptomyces youssoufiensis]
TRSRRRATRKATAPAGGAQGVETPAAEVAAARAPAPEPAAEAGSETATEAVAEPTAEAEPAPRSRTRRRAVRRTATAEPQETAADEREAAAEPAPATRRTRQRAASAPAAPAATTPEAAAEPRAAETTSATPAQEPVRGRRRAVRPPTAVFQAPVFAEPMFQTPETAAAAAAAAGRQDDAYEEEEPAAERATTSSRRRRRRRAVEDEPAAERAVTETTAPSEAGQPVTEPADEADEALADGAAEPEHDAEAEDEGGDRPSRRRRRGGRRRRRGEALDAEGADEHTVGDQAEQAEHAEQASAPEPADEEQHAEDGEPGEDDATGGGSSSSRRRRRRRRRSGDGADATGGDDPERTVVKIREPRERRAKDVEPSDEVQSIKGSTRLEAKKQRRREGREQGRRRVPIITEAEFLARREAVERVMVVRQSGERTQIGVLEDNVLVEHFVNKEQATSYVGNVYLGKVQNVLPSMEAAFVDIGKGRNAVLYAGEVNFEALGMGHGPRRIETALKSGQSVLVQVTKDPIGHKGARLTSQVSLPGRYLVYVPEGSMTGISRKLPDTERARLKQILKKIVPEDAGVIVRTAAEGASEDELTRDVARLQAQWEEIQQKAKSGGSSHAPTLLYGEPDMTVRVVRDIFNEDFSKVIVSGDGAWETIHGYVSHVAPDLADRLQKWTSDVDVFATYRIDEQLMKALDRKVWLPSGGSLVIDRTEAMVVVDVNTGKFTGQGGNLEETVTRNNLEAAEEIVRQLRLRDLGGIIVIDFIDMVLESNRDLVLRRLLECLGRDRTKHQVAEVTSLGLVQMTRKRVGQGLLESFSETCVHCNGRGVLVHMDQPTSAGGGGGGKRGKKKKGGADQHEHVHAPAEAERPAAQPEPAEIAPIPVPAPVAEPVEPAAAEAEEEWYGSAAEAQAAAESGRGSAASRRGRRRASRKASAPAGSPRQAEVSVEEQVAPAAAEAAAPAAAPAAAAAEPV